MLIPEELAYLKKHHQEDEISLLFDLIYIALHKKLKYADLAKQCCYHLMVKHDLNKCDHLSCLELPVYLKPRLQKQIPYFAMLYVHETLLKVQKQHWDNLITFHSQEEVYHRYISFYEPEIHLEYVEPLLIHQGIHLDSLLYLIRYGMYYQIHYHDNRLSLHVDSEMKTKFPFFYIGQDPDRLHACYAPLLNIAEIKQSVLGSPTYFLFLLQYFDNQSDHNLIPSGFPLEIGFELEKTIKSLDQTPVVYYADNIADYQVLQEINCLKPHLSVYLLPESKDHDDLIILSYEHDLYAGMDFKRVQFELIPHVATRRKKTILLNMMMKQHLLLKVLYSDYKDFNYPINFACLFFNHAHPLFGYEWIKTRTPYPKIDLNDYFKDEESFVQLGEEYDCMRSVQLIINKFGYKPLPLSEEILF